MPEITNISPQIIKINDKYFSEKNINVFMLRLDEIHPFVSGNKIFKLYYFLEEAKKSAHKKIITFGGAYSNHLAATAFACNERGIESLGFVRGEQPLNLSHTLLFCLENNMKIEFLDRSSYKKINDHDFLKNLTDDYGKHTLIPEGGFSKEGVDGAAMIGNHFDSKKYTHVCCAVGTATTFAGLIKTVKNEAEVIGFSALKKLKDINERLAKLKIEPSKKYHFIEDYHFAGYAKKTPELISFMNLFYTNNKIPLDFVYTGKMMFGVYDLINKNYFPEGSAILCIHTGGLQGNNSLPHGTLNFDFI